MGGQATISLAFAGLGAMGFGMATNLVKKGYQVTGFDVYAPTLDRFQVVGGGTATSPREAAKGKSIFVCMVANSQQADSVLFDKFNGAINSLPQHATIILCSTVPAAYLESIDQRLTALNRRDIKIVDSPVSGGSVRAGEGALTILSSGSSEALASAKQILNDMSATLHIIPGGIGAASKVKMVNQLLAGVHIAAAAEAMGLAAKMGLNTRTVFDVIKNAAGNSWMFENRVPHMLDNDWTPRSALDIFVKDMGIVTSSARICGFPLPLSSTAEQLYISGSSQGYGRDDDAGLVRVFLPQSPNAVHDLSKTAVPTQSLSPNLTPVEINKIGFIGLGAMGIGMAMSLTKAGFPVCGYDIYSPSVERFSKLGGNASSAQTPADVAVDAQVLVLMVQNALQAEDVLFGSGKAADSLPNDSIVILSSTVPPSFVRDLRSQLVRLGRNIELVDAPVSGGVVRAANGQLTIICSAEEKAMSRARPLISAMTGMPKNLHHIDGGVGAASSVKLINQLLAGVHIAAAAEAMAFGAKLGLDTKLLYEIIKTAAGGSWMFENRVPAMLNADWTPHSALAIFVKDLGIVLDESKRLMYGAPLSAAAHQLYLMGVSHGWSKEADEGVVRVWELLAGISVAESCKKTQDAFTPREYPKLPLQKTIEALPPAYIDDMLPEIVEQVNRDDTPVLVVLDDDPTGTQTCHDIAVLTVWDHETLVSELNTTTRGFFILTNSRALPPTESRALIKAISENLAKAAKQTGKALEIVLRGDSTLRGHFPDEPEAVEEVLGEVDNWILAPFFYQGGRYTIDDVHYVAEGDVLVPASQTPFAADATFGYKSSNLRDYVLEKAGTRFKKDNIFSVTLQDIRSGPERIAERLLSAPKRSVIIVNAAAESDMYVFVAGLLRAQQKSGKKYLYRTGAAFVSCRLGITSIPPLSAHDLGISKQESRAQTGGLIIAGSYVPKTTAQLASLRTRRGEKLHVIELNVSSLIQSPTAIIESAISSTDQYISSGKDVLVMTSRTLVRGADALSSLSIGGLVADAPVKILQGIKVRPRYIVAKGGITSSDAATKGLGIKRAMVLGQAASGVPLWRCEEESSKFKGIPYVVFPGNVGGNDTLAELVESWAE